MKKTILFIMPIMMLIPAGHAFAKWTTDPDPTITQEGNMLILHKELYGFNCPEWYGTDCYGVEDGAADVLYRGESNTWTFDSSIFPDGQPMYFNLSAVLDDHYVENLANYSMRITVNGIEVFNGGVGDILEHGSPYGSVFINWSELTFDAWSNWTITIENTSTSSWELDWIAFDWIELAVDITINAAIDIKPGSDPNSINLSSAGVVPVAVLSSETFDATTIDPDTVSLAGARVKMVGKSGKYLSHAEDVNGDGLLDLVCNVQTAEFMIETGNSVALLEAETYDGIPVRGEDTVNIVPDN